MKVATFWSGRGASASRRRCILTTRPPTLIARSSATQRRWARVRSATIGGVENLAGVVELGGPDLDPDPAGPQKQMRAERSHLLVRYERLDTGPGEHRPQQVRLMAPQTGSNRHPFIQLVGHEEPMLADDLGAHPHVALAKRRRKFLQRVSQHRSRHRRGVPGEKLLFVAPAAVTNLPEHPADRLVDQVLRIVDEDPGDA